MRWRSNHYDLPPVHSIYSHSTSVPSWASRSRPTSPLMRRRLGKAKRLAVAIALVVLLCIFWTRTRGRTVELDPEPAESLSTQRAKGGELDQYDKMKSSISWSRDEPGEAKAVLDSLPVKEISVEKLSAQPSVVARPEAPSKFSGAPIPDERAPADEEVLRNLQVPVAGSLAGTSLAPIASVLPETEDVSEVSAPAPSIASSMLVEPTSTQSPEQTGDLKLAFPPWEEYVASKAKAEELPEMIFIPFQDAVADVKLAGWEDEWIADGVFDADVWGKLAEPKIDFVYNWVNGSEEAFIETIRPYELNSSLNDPEGEWIASHGVNRYRDWDELRYSIRSVEKYVQMTVRWCTASRRPGGSAARPTLREWSKCFRKRSFSGKRSGSVSQLTTRLRSKIRSIIHLRKLIGSLFGPTMGFKTNSYDTHSPPGESDAERFGEKPFLIYTSWLLNRRFGNRKRKGQVHFGHSLSRSVLSEALSSFPKPAARSACERFRGEQGFQIYSWYVAFHYTIERHREALLWSYVMLRSDVNNDGYLDWSERQAVIAELAEGLEQEGSTTFRKRMFYEVEQFLIQAGLEPPQVNIDTLWTSLDGPSTIRDIECFQFDIDSCLGPGFSSNLADANFKAPIFSAAAIFDRITREDAVCGDCFIKLLLNRKSAGLSPMLPFKETHPKEREVIVKALMRYQYTVVEPDALFVMVTDAEQVYNTLIKRILEKKRPVGQLCLNDDVEETDPEKLEDLQETMTTFFQGLFPHHCLLEKKGSW